MSQANFPAYRGRMEYVCQNCGKRFPGDELFYTCPDCGGVFLLEDLDFTSLGALSGKQWRAIFDSRASFSDLPGIFRFYELLAPIFEPGDLVSIGEGLTPIVEATPRFRDSLGLDFAFKNDGQNPSASFKDRGMACAFSYLKWLCRRKDYAEILTVCASTGDTSASAALYAAYVGPPLKSVVLLPKGKVTPQQLSQPLGSGATVLEIPGVFDDCMKVVEILAEKYRVALLNSKNSWRILGQESYAYECAQHYAWNMQGLCLFVPIGNAGNITAILSGMLKLKALGIISELPRIFGVQSEHADPVYRYYAKPESERAWAPVKVRPSVAQAAMIGNPVSFPRVRNLAARYQEESGKGALAFQVLRVREQQIIEAMLEANRHGHIACTQGGECLAGLKEALALGLIGKNERALLDSTAHSLKFSGFQEMYFNGHFPDEYEISPKPELAAKPEALLTSAEYQEVNQKDDTLYARLAAERLAKLLELKAR